MPTAMRSESSQSERWQQVKTVALRRWDLITPDELDHVRGNTERMIELLQHRYGFAREQATRELMAWSKSLHPPSPAAAVTASAAR